jgi:hypothetical protein
MNELNDEIKPYFNQLLKRTPDDFGLTLSGNIFTKATIDEL